MEELETKKGSALSPAKVLVLGGMLFSMFFGAGNLILPPLVGFQAGDHAIVGMAGFLIAAIGLPVLGIIAVAMAGDVRDLAGRVNKHFATIFISLIYLSIGPFLAIPRTATTALEMAKPLVGNLGSELWFTVLFCVLFFGVAFTMAIRPSALSKILGRITAPILLVLLALIIGASILGGLGLVPEAAKGYAQAPLTTGFLAGYQTMDLLAALCFGIIVAMNVRAQGVTDDGKVAVAISGAGIVAGALMCIVYCGLAFIGVSMSSQLPGATNGAALLAVCAATYFGPLGSVLIAAIFFIACLNVCTGLISCCSEYFNELLPKTKFMWWAIGLTVFSLGASLFGLDAILAFSVPLLGILYPPAICLMVLGVAARLTDRVPMVWPFVVLPVVVVSVANVLRSVFAPNLELVIDMLPLAADGLGWVSVAVVCGLVGALVSWVSSKAKAPKVSS